MVHVFHLYRPSTFWIDNPVHAANIIEKVLIGYGRVSSGFIRFIMQILSIIMQMIIVCMSKSRLCVVGLFHRLMSRVVQQVGRRVQLFYRQIYFPVARNHWVLIEMIPHPEALIKVCQIMLERNLHLEKYAFLPFNLCVHPIPNLSTYSVTK